MLRLFRDQRCQNLTPDLHHIMGRQIVLQYPFIGATFIGGSAGRHPGLITVPVRDHPGNIPRDPHDRGQHGSHLKIDGAAETPIVQIKFRVGDWGKGC